ncbi:MAG TPA: hypothetical protein VKM54_09905 [Myxococcota bacterium]|nr:hypothetical protein [Myxococcota bacterium]
MSESAVFESACQELAQATSFDSLSARGTIRLALKSSGLDAREVTAAQMIVVVKRVLPGELKARGVKEPDAICSTIARRLSGLAPAKEATSSSVEDVFRRLGGA